MAKKRKNKRVSARGHEENKVIRFREKLVKKRYRIDENGDRIYDDTLPPPVNTFDRNWLAQKLAEVGNKPPVDHSSIPPPNNVTPISNGKPKAVSMSGNEAEQRDDPPDKLAFDSPPSTVHNPFLKPDSGGYADDVDTGPPRARPLSWHNQRNRKPLNRVLTPSGLPISYFTEGPYKPTEKPVVYTTETAPTPTRHWTADSSNDMDYDNSVKVRRTSDERSWPNKMRQSVQWFINHVQVQNWPSEIYQYVRWHSDGPVVNTGAINKAAAMHEESSRLSHSLYEGIEQDWKAVNSALNMAHAEINRLNRERMSLEHQLAMHTGDIVSAEEIAREMDEHDGIKTKTPPEDADVLLSQFNVFNSFVKCDGLPAAFARYVYGDPRLGEVIQDHADMRCREREDAALGRTYARNLSKFMYQLGKQGRQDYQQWWCDEYPKFLKRRNRAKFGAVRSVPSEACAYAAMSRKGKPRVERSIYYSRLDSLTQDRSPFRNNAMAGALISMIKPTAVRYNNPRLVDGDNRTTWYDNAHRTVSYERWWCENIDRAELNFYYKKHPVKVALTKAYIKTVDTLNTELNPIERKRKNERIAKLLADQRVLDEQREQRREERAECKRRKAERAHIRKMQSIAH